METLSHKFIEALAVPRDRLYGLALARAGTPAGAEAALQQTARAVFCEFAKDAVTDIPSAMEETLAAVSPGTGTSSTTDAASAISPGLPMPADVWARLAAAVQIEAARSSHAQALNPDSVLLQPDPMLAPKKSRPRADDAEFDVSSPARFLTFLGAAVLVGLVITLYIMTRPPASRPPSTPASQSAPAKPAIP